MDAFLGILQRGLPKCDACTAAGITDKTAENWMKRGERFAKKEDRGEAVPEAEAPFVRFFREAKKAAAMGKAELVDIIRTKALDAKDPKAWCAAAWLLERMHPQQFGRKVLTVQASGPNGGPIPVDAPAPVVKVVFQGAAVQHPEVVEVPEDDAGEGDA